MFIRDGRLAKLFAPSSGNVSPEAIQKELAEKDKAINELESLFESKYLRYTDPLIPVHFLGTIVVSCQYSRRLALVLLRYLHGHVRDMLRHRLMTCAIYFTL